MVSVARRTIILTNEDDDIFSALNSRNLHAYVRNVLSYLSCDDLVRANMTIGGIQSAITNSLAWLICYLSKKNNTHLLKRLLIARLRALEEASNHANSRESISMEFQEACYEYVTWLPRCRTSHSKHHEDLFVLFTFCQVFDFKNGSSTDLLDHSPIIADTPQQSKQKLDGKVYVEVSASDRFIAFRVCADISPKRLGCYSHSSILLYDRRTLRLVDAISSKAFICGVLAPAGSSKTVVFTNYKREDDGEVRTCISYWNTESGKLVTLHSQYLNLEDGWEFPEFFRESSLLICSSRKRPSKRRNSARENMITVFKETDGSLELLLQCKTLGFGVIDFLPSADEIEGFGLLFFKTPDRSVQICQIRSKCDFSLLRQFELDGIFSCRDEMDEIPDARFLVNYDDRLVCLIPNYVKQWLELSFLDGDRRVIHIFRLEEPESFFPHGIIRLAFEGDLLIAEDSGGYLAVWKWLGADFNKSYCTPGETVGCRAVKNPKDFNSIWDVMGSRHLQNQMSISEIGWDYDKSRVTIRLSNF